MKPAPFELVRPATVDDAVAVLADPAADAKPLAGGQSLVPLLAMRLATPATLVDLNTIGSLTGIDDTADERVRFGAMTRQSTLVRSRRHGLVAHASAWIGHTAIRSRGTIGGSVAHADPSAELPSVAVACDGVIGVAGPDGSRTIAAVDLFESMLETTLRSDEIITEVTLRRPQRWGFAEFARRDGDFALVLAVIAEVADGWRVVLGGVGPTPWRCRDAERLLDDSATDMSGLDEAILDAVADTVETFDDVHASAEYRRAMAAEFTARALADMADREPGDA
ncbi:MAG: FAD binding domain-containing protein [Actinomycetota bacterium]